MDNLKEYLLLHKPELDVDCPADDAWEHIESRLSDETHPVGLESGSGFPAKSGARIKVEFPTRIVRYAAAACLIALAGVGLWLGSGTEKREAAPKSVPAPEEKKIESTAGAQEKSPVTDIARNTPKHTSNPKRARHKARLKKPAAIPDETAAIDKSYSSLIDYQLKKLRATPLYAENGSYFSFYVEQFKQMDQDELAVKKDIAAYGLTTEYLEQLINVYQQKLNVLKNLQTEINKMNNKVRGKEGPSDKAEVHYLNI